MRRYHYIESGLDDVWLLNGFSVETFGSYGEAVGVQKEQELWRLLGRNIARQDRRMNGQELRFLRALLDWSQVGLGERLGYADHQMVAKWEKARHEPIPIQADTFVRGCYLESIKQKPMLARISRRLADLARSGAPRPSRRVLRRNNTGEWEAQELPAEMNFAGRPASSNRTAPQRRVA